MGSRTSWIRFGTDISFSHLPERPDTSWRHPFGSLDNQATQPQVVALFLLETRRFNYACSPSNLIGVQTVVFDLHDRLPAQAGRVLNRVQLRRRRAVIDDVEPVVLFHPLGRAILVLGQRDLPDAGPPLHLDEAHLDGGLRIVRVLPARDQVESPVLALDRLDRPAALALVGDRPLDRDPLDLGVGDHR
jgi:hypothetical protein